MIGQKIDFYEIVAKLGEGGMGEVYRVRETRPNRGVALKIPPETTVSSTSIEWTTDAAEEALSDVHAECHFEFHRAGKIGKSRPTDENAGEDWQTLNHCGCKS